ncbi:Crp/Fnr family transcriptional regulator [Mycobacteriaceae bacterium 1482268.1]|nr:Crp/Fnr family transcriptional regulator [Mycobacteriaceae bacterium 1482268.1]
MTDVSVRNALDQGVSLNAARTLRRQLTPVSFRRNAIVFREGEPGDRLYIIVAGKVKVGRRTPDGRESVVSVMGPDDMFGELALVDSGPRTSTVTALTNLRALAMDKVALQACIAEHPEIAAQLLRVLTRRLRRTNENLCDLISTDVAGRLANQLLDLARRFGVRQGDDALRVDHELTQSEMAQLVGATREAVNKALGEFSERGWIRIQGKTVFLNDTEQLRRRAAG